MSWSEMSPYVKETAHRVLTPRQQRILEDTLNGHSIATIAMAYGLSQTTVRQHRDRALQKLAPFLDPDRKDKTT